MNRLEIGASHDNCTTISRPACSGTLSPKWCADAQNKVPADAQNKAPDAVGVSGAAFIDPPLGPAVASRLGVKTLNGPGLVRALWFAQLDLRGIERIRPVRRKHGPSSAERRAARIAAGKLSLAKLNGQP